MLAAVLVFGIPGHAYAEESAALGDSSGAGAGKGGYSVENAVPAESEDRGSEPGPAGNKALRDGNSAQEGSVLEVKNYEIFSPGDSSESLDVLRKGKKAKVVVYVKADGIKTEDVGKNGLSVSKLSDSFKMSGAPKVKVTSDKDEDLEFTVTFSKLVYQGRGSELRFRTNFKKGDFPSETQEVSISQCEESASGRERDSDEISGQPVIKIRRSAPETAVGPGENFVLGLELQNTSSDSDIEDLVVSVVPGNSVFIGDDTNSKIIRSLDSKKTVSVKLNMIAGSEISGPTQVVDLELKYNYYSGGTLTSGSSSQKVLIPVKGGSASGQPIIQVRRTGLDRAINAGEAFQVTINLQNTSKDKEIRNLAAIFEPNDQISLLEETDTRQLGDLKAGESVDIPVHLKAGAELSAAASQLLGMTLKFDYDSDKGPVQGTYSEKIVIPTNGQGKDPGNPTPNVIVTNYTYGDKVTAGQVFDLEMEFSNTSTAAAVENVVLSLDTGEGISINSSSNTFYIPRMNPGENKKEKVQVQALFQSKLQSPKITISCKYEFVDKGERKQSSSTETIAIPVYQPDRFQIGKPVFSEEFREGEEGTISIPYVNKGRGQIYNVEAGLEGEIGAISRDLNIGNVESGKSGTIDFVVTPLSAGKFEGEVTVMYEDETEDVKTEKIPVSFEVQEEAADLYGEEDEMELESSSMKNRTGFWFLGAAVILAAGAGAAVFVIKKKKKKEEEVCDDEWEEYEDIKEENEFLTEEEEET